MQNNLSSHHRFIIYFLGVILAVAAIGSGLQGFINAWGGSQDFVWGLSRALLFRQDPYAISAEWLKHPGTPNPFIAESIQANYMAPGLVFLWPIAALPWEFAKVAWAGVGFFCAAIICVVLNKRYLDGDNLTSIVLFCALLISAPMRATIGNAQASLFVFAAFILALDVVDRRPRLAAILLAASWLKYPLIFPLTLMFMRKGRFLTIIQAGLIHVGLLLFLSGWLGQDPVTLLFAPLPFMGQLKAAGFIDVFSITNSLGVTTQLVPVIFSIVLCLIAIVAVLLKNPDNDSMVKASRDRELLVLSLLSIVSCVWVYHRIYDLVVLIVPLCYIIIYVRTSDAIYDGAWIRLSGAVFSYLAGSMIITTWVLLSRTIESKITAMAGPLLSGGIHGVAIMSTYGAIAIGLISLLLQFKIQNNEV